ELLLDNGADQTLPGAYMAAIPLHKAAYNGHAKMLRLLSQYPGYQQVLNAQGPNNGYTPLHDAVWHGHLEAAKVLVETGARLDLKGYDGNTPLQLAEQNGYSSLVYYLKAIANK
ncbi:MAG: ankyrin repeat domain-containing protein, partial [Shewanella sp.]